MNPPLRQKEDVEALKEGLKNDIMDAISTDHAPHSKEEKEGSMTKAAFGIVGLETAVPLTITNLVRTGVITPLQMAAKMSTNPAKIAGIKGGSLKEGEIADIVVIDPEEKYIIDVEQFKSKGRNTPFGGYEVYGMVKYTISEGDDI